MSNQMDKEIEKGQDGTGVWALALARQVGPDVGAQGDYEWVKGTSD